MGKSLYNIIPIESLLSFTISEYLESDKSHLDKLRKIPLLKKILNEKKIKNISEKLLNDIAPYRDSLQEAANSDIDCHGCSWANVRPFIR